MTFFVISFRSDSLEGYLRFMGHSGAGIRALASSSGLFKMIVTRSFDFGLSRLQEKQQWLLGKQYLAHGPSVAWKHTRSCGTRGLPPPLVVVTHTALWETEKLVP